MIRLADLPRFWGPDGAFHMEPGGMTVLKWHGSRWRRAWRGWLNPAAKQEALADYWAATTPAKEQDAYWRMKYYGFPPAYGEPW